VGSKHRRSWSTLDGSSGEFESGYWAAIARLESERVVGCLFTVVDWLTFGYGVYGFDPRYRVLVGRSGTDGVVGVREARTRGRARRELAAVETILATSTEEGVRGAFGLDF
jgi:hypothetical protein